MIPYIIIFIILILLKNNKYNNIFSFIILFLFMGSRYEIGSDWELYYSIAQKIEYLDYSIFYPFWNEISPIQYGWGELYRYFNFEISNRVLYKIVWFFKCPQLIIYIYSFLILIFIKLGLKNIKKEYIKYSWILFFSFQEFFLLDLNLMRQAVAISIIFFSYKYIIKENKSKFIICILVAMSFHTSAILCIFLYLVNYLNSISRKTMIILYFLCYFVKDITLIILKNSTFIPDKYIGYLQQTFSGGIKINYLLNLLGIFFIIFIANKYETRKLVIIILIGFYINIIFKGTGFLVIRTRVYFLIFSLYMTPLLYKNKIRKYIFYICCFILLNLSLLNDIVSEYGGIYVPYKIYFLRNNKEY